MKKPDVSEPTVERITAAAGQAVAEFGFDSHDLELVSHYMNTTFRLTTSCGRYVVRVHRAAGRTAKEVAGEIAWLEALSLEADISVPGVRRTPRGEGIVLVTIPERERKLPVTILDWMSGRAVRKKDSHHFEKLGRLTATLHRHARAWRPGAKVDRPTYDSRNVFRRDVPVRIAETLGAARAHPVIAALSTLQGRLETTQERLGTGTDVFGLIHGDLSFGNFLFNECEVIPIDFDDCGFGYFLHDLAVPLAGAFGEPGFQERYGAFVMGYRQILALPPDSLTHLPVFLGLRAAQLILDYAKSSPWPQGILDQLRSRLRPALEESLSPLKWAR